MRWKKRVFILKLLSSHLPRAPSDAPEWPRGFPKASHVVTEENSGRKQESLVATPRQNTGRLHLSTVCCGNSSGTEPGVSQEDVRGDIKDV